MASRLLVIDDSPTIRKAIEIAFRGTNWIADFAPNGREGVLKAKNAPPDAIILDFVLPDMRGVDVCEHLAAEPRTASVPILVVSGKGETVRDLFRSYASVVGCINKPFSVEELPSRVEAAVHRSSKALPPLAHPSRARLCRSTSQKPSRERSTPSSPRNWPRFQHGTASWAALLRRASSHARSSPPPRPKTYSRRSYRS